LNNHGLSLQTLHFRQSTKKWKKTNLTALALDCLTNLKIGELDILGDMWPFYLLAKNYKRLHHLHLSNETALANLYTNGGDINRGNTNEFIKKLEYEFATLDESAVPTMQLKSLSLCGLDLSMLVKDFLKPGIDFNNLDSLTLESCTELNRAFPMLIGARGIPHNTVGPLRLRTFVLRHENPNQEFMIDLEIFLLSLRPLNSLHILLQGLGPCPSLESVLKFHGKALLSLIWDHRFKARTTASISTTTRYGSFDHMRWIAKYCVRLQALGITLDWETLSRSDEYHNKVRDL